MLQELKEWLQANGVKFSVEETQSGWWIDITSHKEPLSIENRGEEVFGLHIGEGEGYGELPEEIFRSLRDLKTRISNLMDLQYDADGRLKLVDCPVHIGGSTLPRKKVKAV